MDSPPSETGNQNLNNLHHLDCLVYGILWANSYHHDVQHVLPCCYVPLLIQPHHQSHYMSEIHSNSINITIRWDVIATLKVIHILCWIIINFWQSPRARCSIYPILAQVSKFRHGGSESLDRWTDSVQNKQNKPGVAAGYIAGRTSTRKWSSCLWKVAKTRAIFVLQQNFKLAPRWNSCISAPDIPVENKWHLTL